MIYHQTMTPSWIETHASYIDSSHASTAEQITFNAGSGSIKDVTLLKVPMIPAGVLGLSTPLTVEITVANDVSIGKSVDSDVRYGVSDGGKFVGFQANDKENYNSFSPCYGVEGTSGMTLTGIRSINHSLPRPTDSFYPGQFVFTLKLDERWGSCYTAHDGGFVKTAGYSSQLMLNSGLTLEVYKQDAGERVGIKYIKVAIIRDD